MLMRLRQASGSRRLVHLSPEFAKAMGDGLAAGKIHYVEDMIKGLDTAPAAFIGLLRAENFGKRVIHVGVAKMIENKESHI